MAFFHVNMFLVVSLYPAGIWSSQISSYYDNPCGGTYTLTADGPAARFLFYLSGKGRNQGDSCDVKVTSDNGTYIAVRVRQSFRSVKRGFLDCGMYPCVCQKQVYVNLTDSSGFASYSCVTDHPRDDVFTSINDVDIRVTFRNDNVFSVYGIVYQLRNGICRSIENRCENTGLCIHNALFNDRNINYCNVEGFLNNSAYTVTTENNAGKNDNESEGGIFSYIIPIYFIVNGALLIIGMCVCYICCCRRKESDRPRSGGETDSNVPSVYSVSCVSLERPDEKLANMPLEPPAYDTLDWPPSYKDASDIKKKHTFDSL